jgi:transposase
LFNAFDAFKNARQALLQYVDNLKTRLMDATQASQVVEEDMKRPAEFISTLRTALLASASYRETWQLFEPQLASTISDSQAIRQIDAIGKALAAESAIATLTRYVESQIMTLKRLKRQSYGRAKLDLLRQRMLHAA